MYSRKRKRGAAMRNHCKKKVFSMIMAIAMLFSVIAPGDIVKAASDRTLQVVTDKTSVRRGDTFTATVRLSGDFTGDYNISGGHKVSGGQATLQYDPKQLELVGEPQIGEVFDSSIRYSEINSDEAGSVVLAFYGRPHEEIGAEILYTATFKVKSGASGKIGLSFADAKFNHTYTYKNEEGKERDELQPIDVTSKGTEVSVEIPLEKITLNKTNMTLNKGDSETLTVSCTPADASVKKVTWSTSDSKVATVTNGVVKAVGKGKASITAKVGDRTAVCAVQVNNPVKSISIPAVQNLKKGQTALLKVTTVPADAELGAVTWKSDNPKTAEVSSSGLVTAKADGTAKITATVGKLTAVCVVNVKEIKLESISLDKKTITVARNKSQKLHVIYNPAETTDDKKVTWSVSDPTVITVDGDGNITGKSVGNAIVSAQVGKFSAQCEVTVNAPLEKIELAKSELELIKGQSSDALKVVKYFPDDTTDSKAVKWTSNNEAVAAVDDQGSITAKKAGTAVITVAGVNHTTAVCKVTVKEIPIEGIVLSHTEAEVEEGETLQLQAHVYPKNTTDDDKRITWKSQDEKIASVDSTGLVTAVKGGRTTITATASNGAKAECQICVPIHMEGIKIQKPSSTEVLKGKTISLTAKAVPENTTDVYAVTWTSSDPAIATVDKDGMVTGLKEGTVTITAKGALRSTVFEDSIEITVKEIHMTGFELSYHEENLSDGKLLKGQSLRIDTVFTPENTTDDRTVTWSVSDDQVAAIDQNGVVTGLKAGKVTVTAKVGAFEQKLKMEVKEIPLKSIAFDKVISTMTEGEKAVLHIIYNPENTTDLKDVEWSSSDDKVLAVANGELTAVKAGKAVITAKVGERTVSCEIMVKAKEEIDNTDQNHNTTDKNGNTAVQNANKDKKKNKGGSNVKTGDGANAAVPAVLASASLFVIIMMFLRRKVRR